MQVHRGKDALHHGGDYPACGKQSVEKVPRLLKMSFSKMYRVKANLALVTGLIVAGVIALVSCGKKTEGPTGNSSSYPGNFLALCQSTDKTPALEKTFTALLTSPTESCLDAYSRLMELDEIDLSGKGLSDIRPLASFIDLKSLYLDHNAISSAAALAGLFKLEKLDMSWNDLSSAAPLAELARLETLYLFGNPLGNDVAKTAENCPYADVGKGLRTFCTPPEPKKKRTPVVIVNKKPSASSSKTSSSSSTKTTSNDDSDDADSANDKPKNKRPSREDDQPADNHPQQAEQSSSPKGDTSAKANKANDKATAKKDQRKRAWETSFVPPEDDVDDWGEDENSSEETSERGLTDSPADADIDKAMNKEIAKSTKPEAQKPESTKPEAQAKDASTRPFSTPAPQDVTGKQTTAHSWDQAVGRVFDTAQPGAQGQLPQPGSAAQQEFDWDLVEAPASLDLGAELGGLGQPATSRRVDMEAGLTADDAADSSAAVDDESTSFWSSTLLRTLGFGFKPEPEQYAQQPKTLKGKETQRGRQSKAQQNPASRVQKSERVAKARVPAVTMKTTARPTPKAATRIKSFLAYCLDHSGQPAIAHTIKMLTKPGETCLASYRRLAATESLDLSGKQLTDIAPLASFRNLRKLDLAHNRIGDLKPLAGLTQLNWLNIDHNGLVDIAHLGRLAALVHLTAKHNRIFSVSPLAKLSKLKTIAIKGNPIATDAAKNSGTCPKDAQSRSVQSLCQ